MERSSSPSTSRLLRVVVRRRRDAWLTTYGTPRKLRADARTRLAASADAAAVEALRHELLGRSGALTGLMRSLGEAPAEDRPALGRLANEVRSEIESALAARLAEVTAGAVDARLEAERLDMTAPGEPVRIGHLHPTHDRGA